MEALLAHLSDALGLLLAALLPGVALPVLSGLAASLAGLALLAAMLLAGAGLAPKDRPIEARLAGLAWLATALASIAAVLLGGTSSQLAPFLWLALGFSAASLAGRFLGSSFRNKRVVSALLVLMLGGYLHAEAGASRKASALPADAGAPPALPGARDPEGERRRAEACLAREPGACPCLERRAEASLALFEPERALGEAKAARESCPHRPEPHALVAQALVALGDPEEAKKVIRGAPSSGPGEARVRLVALELGLAPTDKAGPVLAAAREVGLRREADLAEVRLAIRAGELEKARMLADALVASDARDPEPYLVLAELAEREASGTSRPDAPEAARGEGLRRADEALRNALGLAPRHPLALARRATLAHAAGRCTAARKLLADLERIHPTHREVPRLRALLEAEGWNALSPCR